MRPFLRTSVAAGLLAVGLAASADAAHASPAVKTKRGTLTVAGGRAADHITLGGTRKRIRIDVGSAHYTVKRSKVYRIRVLGRGGADRLRIDESAGTIPATLDGGRGRDTLLGGRGAERLLGGPGSDTVDGNHGADTAILGRGDDRFVWDPGDGSDVVEGRAGRDVLAFNGSAASERFEATANGTRARFTRDVGSIVMDLDGVEQIAVAAQSGTDTLVTNDLAATDVRAVDGDLGPDAADQAIVNATNAPNALEALGRRGSVVVAGLAAAVGVTNAERLAVNAFGGNDRVSASTLTADAIRLTLDGGAGDDVELGGRGADVLLGGDGRDAIDGNEGDDTALMGAGDDAFTWDPGDGSDTIEGAAGTDRMRFNGAGAAERFDVSANGPRVRFLRDLANIAMDLDDVEWIDLAALGGRDRLTVNDLSGTDIADVNADLADEIVVNGTNGDDVMTASGAGSVSVIGLRTRVDVTHADTLSINALAGDDVFEASGLAGAVLRLTADGGAGDDALIGSAGADTLLGRDGDDVLLGGPGQDVLDGGAGDNVVIQD